ncbi:probable family 17 glucosidase Scw10p [Diutina catenulata]
MLFKNIVLASVASLAMAAPAAHKHHEHKRAVHTVYVTAGAPAPAATPAADQSINLDGVNKNVAAPVASSPEASPEASSGDSGNAPTAGSAGAHGVTYSVYTSGEPKGYDTVKQEVAKLSGYNVIRLYGVDCEQIEKVKAAMGDNQKLFLGLFEPSSLDADLTKLINAVNGDWDKVDTISVGNELVNMGKANPAQLKGYVAKAKSKLQAAGYHGPVTTTDTFIATINNPELCDVGDYVTVNAHAFFDDNTSASQAGDWVVEQIQRVKDACGGKKVLISESGWPWRSDAGYSKASADNQRAAIESIKAKAGDSVILLAGFDEPWKQDSGATHGCEKYWGINHEN